MQNEILKDLKKLLKLYDNQNVFNVWIQLFTAKEYRNNIAVFGIEQSTTENENGVYKLYIYGKNSTDIKVVSKQALLKEVKNLIQ